jgi:hypothetical protein
MLETTKSGTEMNVKGKADGYRETSAQLAFTGAIHTQWYGGTK